jgi:hypothetical protein
MFSSAQKNTTSVMDFILFSPPYPVGHNLASQDSSHMQACGKAKSVEVGDDPGVPSFSLRVSPPPDSTFRKSHYFLAHITGTVWLKRAS